MKKILLSVILFIVFIPVIVNAEENIYIDSIKLEEVKGETIELEEATVNDKTVNLNLRMTNIDDEIRYKIDIKNETKEDYEINKNNINISSDYLDYALESDDNNIIKANTSKTVYLRVKYSNEVDQSKFVNGVYQDNITMKLNLRTNDDIPNPKTGLPYLIIISFLLIISGLTLIVFKKKKLSTLTILIGIILLPIGVKALNSYEIIVDSKVEITNIRNYKVTFINCRSENSEVFEYVNGMTWREYFNSHLYTELLNSISVNDNVVRDTNFIDLSHNRIRLLSLECDESTPNCLNEENNYQVVSIDDKIKPMNKGYYKIGDHLC